MQKILFVICLILTTELVQSQNDDYDILKLNDSQIESMKNQIGFGLENYSATNDINGGNYLYGEYHYMIIPRLAIGAKISSDLSPNTFNDIITHFGLRFRSKIGAKKFGSTFGLNYMRNFKNEEINKDYVELEISLITFFSEGKFELDILPFGLIYCVDSHNIVINYKFVAFKINF